MGVRRVIERHLPQKSHHHRVGFFIWTSIVVFGFRNGYTILSAEWLGVQEVKMNEQELSQALEKYADVVVRVGINLRPGQRLLIHAGIFDYPLVRQITARAYQAGARRVDIIWQDLETLRTHLQDAPREALSESPSWPANAFLEYLEHGDAHLFIVSDDPDAFAGIDPDRVSMAQTAYWKSHEKVYDLIMRDAINWSVVACPSREWALKLFPGATADQAVERLWEAIFLTCRIDQPDPVAAWQRHTADLKKRSAWLNGKHFKALHYRAPGTDLRVGLPERHFWQAAQMKAENEIEFIANMPTEEVFTMPHRDQVNGIVSSTRPFIASGSVVEGFTLTFENGRVTNLSAQKGEESLRKLIEMDEGARSIGEVALVPHSSPVSQRGLMFYSTLFDENAASHIAIGRAYRFTMEGGNEMTEEEFQANGGNFSLTHNDFMVGSDKLDLDGICADGSIEAVMRVGEWAFKL
jgi:aminopeptidase